MSYPFDQNNFGNNYYSFENNVNNSQNLLQQQNQSQQYLRFNNNNNNYNNNNNNNNSMRHELQAKQHHNYQQSSYGVNRVSHPTQSIHGSHPSHPYHNNSRYYRPQQQPFYGQNSGPIRGQYRAQVIDYTNSSHINNRNNNDFNINSKPLLGEKPLNHFSGNHFPINQKIRPFGGMSSTSPSICPPSQPLIGSLQSSQMSGLLPTPNSYQNMPNNPQMIPPVRPYQIPVQQNLMTPMNRGLLPNPNSVSNPSLLHQSYPSLVPQLQQNSPLNYDPKPPVSQKNMYSGYSIPQPIPPPPPSEPPPIPPPPPQPSQPQKTISQIEAEKLEQKKLEVSRIEKLNNEGMENRVQNDLTGFYCLFCEVFCNNVVAAERHVETPKHHRTKIGDNLRGIDAKFTIKSERISETAVALARKEELLKISNVIKNEYFNEGIRLKDGIGSNAYICENCGVFIESLESVKEHLELHKQFTEQLKVCSKPIIGLDFIVEYIDPDPLKPRVYECSMCQTLNTTREIITHVCSFLHRTNFIKKIHPAEGAKYTSETQELSLEAGKRALELETLVGRGHFRVKNQSAPQTLSKAITQVKLHFSELTTTSSTSKPFIQIELPKPKEEHQKTELEKLIAIELKSDEEANEVTRLIKTITDSVMEYHLKSLTPQMRDKFKKQLKENEEIYQNLVK